MSAKAKLIAVTLAACILMSGCSNTVNVRPSDSNVDRFLCEAGQVVIVTDTRTGVQYLAWNNGYGGGMCVLVDADGKPMLTGDVE